MFDKQGEKSIRTRTPSFTSPHTSTTTKTDQKLQVNSLIIFFYLYGPTIGGECEGLNFFSQQTTWLAGKETAVLRLKLVLMAASILLPRPSAILSQMVMISPNNLSRRNMPKLIKTI